MGKWELVKRKSRKVRVNRNNAEVQVVAGETARPAVKCLLHKYEELSSDSQPPYQKLGVAIHPCSASAGGVGGRMIPGAY